MEGSFLTFSARTRFVNGRTIHPPSPTPQWNASMPLFRPPFSGCSVRKQKENPQNNPEQENTPSSEPGCPPEWPSISVLSFTRKTLKTVVCFFSTFVLHGLSKRLYRPVSRKVMNYRQILKSSFDQAISPGTDTRPFPGSSAFWVGFPPTYFSSSSSWPNPRSYVSANSLPLAHNSLFRGSYFYSLFQAGAHGVWVPTAQGPALGHWQGLGTGCE